MYAELFRFLVSHRILHFLNLLLDLGNFFVLRSQVSGTLLFGLGYPLIRRLLNVLFEYLNLLDSRGNFGLVVFLSLLPHSLQLFAKLWWLVDDFFFDWLQFLNILSSLNLLWRFYLGLLLWLLLLAVLLLTLRANRIRYRSKSINELPTYQLSALLINSNSSSSRKYPHLPGRSQILRVH